ncbi:MAG: hypothetical protein NWQ18_09665 [Saprospiraceae bacterium]|nr:hypothetical protein [Saprospiraceae bacterium]
MKNIPGHILMLDQADSLLTHFLTEHGFTVTLDTQSSFATLQSELSKYQGVILPFSRLLLIFYLLADWE